MGTVLVQMPSPDGGPPSQVVHVGPGERVRFGRGAPDCAVDIELPHAGVSRLAGEISAVEDYRLITNLSADKADVVDDPEGGGEYLAVAPRRLAAPVPFEFARLSLPVTEGTISFPLCEPRLRDGSTVALPTAGEIVERLCGHEPCREFTRAAVNYHDDLATTKLRVKEPRPGAGERLECKREALVSIALRFGLVRDEHPLLPPRAPVDGV